MPPSTQNFWSLIPTLNTSERVRRFTRLLDQLQVTRTTRWAPVPVRYTSALSDFSAAVMDHTYFAQETGACAEYGGDIAWSPENVERLSPRHPAFRECACCHANMPMRRDTGNGGDSVRVEIIDTLGARGHVPLCTSCSRAIASRWAQCQGCLVYHPNNAGTGLCPVCDAEAMRNALETERERARAFFSPEIAYAPFNRCRQCGQVETTHYLGGGEAVCLSCLAEINTQRCGHCRTVWRSGRMYRIDGAHLCPSCLPRLTTNCSHCGERHLSREMHSDSWRNICSGCFERSYFRCDRCDCVVPDDNLHEFRGLDICENCHQNAEREAIGDLINQYSYKPIPNFCGRCEKGEAYMGLEIEVQADSRLSTAKAVRSYDGSCEYVYCKYDSTVDVEIVTHPATLAEHTRRLGGLLDAVRKTGARGFNTGSMSCGIHIHIDRSGFTSTQLVKAYLFINRCNAQWAKMGRRISDYAQYKNTKNERGDIMRAKVSGNMDRYEAVNFQPRRTWEMRLFKSTVRTESVLAYVESAHALSSWLLSGSSPGIGFFTWGDSRKLWGEYAAYVSGNRDKYGDHLIPFLIQHELYA